MAQALSKMDLDGAKFVTPGKGCLILFHRFLREHDGDHNNIAEVVCDISSAFLAAIDKSFPITNATVD
ncbi:hypothetical protein DFAR_340060 [Desulfarculales bacterium]